MKRYMKRNFGKKGSKFILIMFFVLLVSLSAGGGFYVFSSEDNNVNLEEEIRPVSVEDSGTYIFKIKNKRLKLNIGDEKKIKIKADDSDAKEAIIWTSSNDKVLHVDPNGKVLALKKGKATVTAQAGYYSSNCTVVVNGNSTKPGKTFSTAYTANKATLDKNRKNGDGKMLYNIKVNRLKNCVTVYTYDSKGKYTVPVRAMICSCGANNNTPQGTFAVFVKNRWHTLFGNVYGQYTTAFNNSILFHSVPYKQMGKPDTVEVNDYNNLGKSISMGCVRLAVADAKWIYDNCPAGTTVVVYEDKKDGPLGTPPSMKINVNKETGWDPTDDDKKNPYYNRTPKFDGVVNVSIDKGEYFDPMNGVSAKDSSGTDISSRIKISGKINENKSGEYIITYSVKDDMNRTLKQYRYVTVR